MLFMWKTWPLFLGVSNTKEEKNKLVIHSENVEEPILFLTLKEDKKNVKIVHGILTIGLVTI